MNLVSFVVILRVVLEDFGLLLVVKASDQLIHIKLLSPFLTVYEPASLLVIVDAFELFQLTSSSQARHRIYVLVGIVAVSGQRCL